MPSIIEKIINFFDLFHTNRIKRFYEAYNLDLVIDVGSHKGEFINFVLDKNIPIFSFEPNPYLRNLLKKNTNSFNVIKYFDYAVSDKADSMKLFINNLSSTSSLMLPNEKSFWIKFKKFILGSQELIKEIIEVKSIDLDSVLLDKIDNYNNILLKIDIEGAEGSALKGAVKILNSKKIKFIQIEKAAFDIYKGNIDDPHAILNELEFKPIKKFRFPLLNFSDVVYSKI